ncbi:hypothetical protein GQ600_15830 [Phytophthora cactorum]|nr:hypothetical protein GQ600_15830 [Phytophthora cactorum]
MRKFECVLLQFVLGWLGQIMGAVIKNSALPTHDENACTSPSILRIAPHPPRVEFFTSQLSTPSERTRRHQKRMGVWKTDQLAPVHVSTPTSGMSDLAAREPTTVLGVFKGVVSHLPHGRALSIKKDGEWVTHTWQQYTKSLSNSLEPSSMWAWSLTKQ